MSKKMNAVGKLALFSSLLNPTRNAMPSKPVAADIIPDNAVTEVFSGESARLARFRRQPKVHVIKSRDEPGRISYTPREVAAMYNFPTDADGTGQRIAIIELGGGYRQADLDQYWDSLGMTKRPAVSAVSVDGGKNKPIGNPNSADAEVQLDIQIAGSVAPGAKIDVYFAPNTDNAIVDSLLAAINSKTPPNIISLSWGAPESEWTPQELQATNAALQLAAQKGITVLVAAGDGGSTDGVTDTLQHVDFPASSPYAVACGGTTLTRDGKTISQKVWNDLPLGGATGGGVSDAFALPAWQENSNVPPSVNPPGDKVGRGLPDISGDADPQTGYKVRIDGTNQIYGGTSAVAPLYAGLFALVNQSLGKPVGFPDPAFYQREDSADFTKVTEGNCNAYAANPNPWNPCTGLGSIDGNELRKDLSETPPTMAQRVQERKNLAERESNER